MDGFGQQWKMDEMRWEEEADEFFILSQDVTLTYLLSYAPTAP